MGMGRAVEKTAEAKRSRMEIPAKGLTVIGYILSDRNSWVGVIRFKCNNGCIIAINNAIHKPLGRGDILKLRKNIPRKEASFLIISFGHTKLRKQMWD